MVYDAFHSRSIVIAQRQLRGGEPFYGNFDLAAQGQTAAGAWIVDGLAYDARNNTTPEGRIEITSLADEEIANGVISLREALKIANGALTTGFSAPERQALERGGCIFNESGAIVGGCGRGITDTLFFTNTITGTVNLLTPLPPINDSAPTRLAGGGRRDQPRIVIDGGALPALDAVLTVTSTYNEINGLHLHGGRRGVWLLGDGNTVENAIVTGATVAGIDIRGDGNSLSNVDVGALQDEVTCSRGRNRVGVNIQDNAAHNELHGLRIGCSQEQGILLSGPGVISTTALFTFVGGNTPDTANLGGGIVIRNGARENQFFLLASINNGIAGVSIADAPQNTLTSGLVLSNTGPGFLLSGPGATGNALSGFQFISNTVGVLQQSGAAGNRWHHNAYGPSSSGRAIDTGTLGADNPPAATVRAYNPLTRVASGIGATPGATVTVHAIVKIGRLDFAYALSDTVAGPDGAWSATLPPLPVPDGGVRPVIPAPGPEGVIPIFGDYSTGFVVCVRVIETTASAGSSELSAAVCGYAVGLPALSR